MAPFYYAKSSAHISVNPGVDTSETDVKKALHFLPDFTKYWSAKDCENYTSPDQLLYGINSDMPTYNMGHNRTILYIKPEKEFINIKTHFGWTDSLKNISTLCITNHYIKFDNNLNPQFVNPVEINSKPGKAELFET